MSSLRAAFANEPRGNGDADASVGFEAVVEQLLAVAERVETAVREHDALAPLEELTRVREGAAKSRGELRALYEVAEAFLHAFDRGDFGVLGLELARFVRKHGDVAREMLRAANDVRGLRPSDVPQLVVEEARALVEAGALRESDGVIRVRPSVRAAVAELVEPASVRMWRLVERARRSALTAPPARRVEVLAQKLGVGETLAKEVLGTNGNASPVTRRREFSAPPRRVLTSRVVYSVNPVDELPMAPASDEEGLLPVVEALSGRGQGPRVESRESRGSIERRMDQDPFAFHSSALH